MKSILFNDQYYTPLQLLGKGKSGYSYLVTDGILFYVLKQIHHEPCDYYTFGDKLQAERSAYAKLSQIGIPMPKLLACDIQTERILKEYIPGETVFDLIRQNRMHSDYLKQIHAMCQLLYAAHTNIDYFPTNFVVHQDQLYYVDYECNDYMEQWNFENWGITYWSRTPEFIAYAHLHFD